jgi:hypothetical protein
MDHDQGGPGCNPCGHHDTTSIHPIHAVIKFELSHLNGQDSSKFLIFNFWIEIWLPQDCNSKNNLKENKNDHEYDNRNLVVTFDWNCFLEIQF